MKLIKSTVINSVTRESVIEQHCSLVKVLIKYVYTKCVTDFVQKFLQLQTWDTKVQGEETCRSISGQPFLQCFGDLVHLRLDVYLWGSNSNGKMNRSGSHLDINIYYFHPFLTNRAPTFCCDMKDITAFEAWLDAASLKCTRGIS